MAIDRLIPNQILNMNPPQKVSPQGTRSHYVGMVPITAQVDDHVIMIPGARVPYLVRPVPGTSDPVRCHLVGECYVHGIMKGELEDTEVFTELDAFFIV